MGGKESVYVVMGLGEGYVDNHLMTGGCECLCESVRMLCYTPSGEFLCELSLSHYICGHTNVMH